MRLTKREIVKITSNYRLGLVKKIKHIKEGDVNECFNLSTDKGNFIVQILGNKLDEQKKNQMNLQFKVLNLLHKNNFSYKTPIPLKNKKNKYLLTINDKNLWVYEKISGKFFKKYNEKQIFESGKVLALYHEKVKNLKINGKQSYNHLFGKLQKIFDENKKNKNLEFICNVYSNLKKSNYEGDLIPIHADFNKTNLLYSGNNLIGIIDFDNLSYDYYIKDIALSLMRLCIVENKIRQKDWNYFLKGYYSIKKISINEERLIVPNIIRMKCYMFYRAFLGNDPVEIKEITNLIKKLLKL